MATKSIPFVPTCYYHIYNHGNGDDNIFRVEENYPYFLRRYIQYMAPLVSTYAWCLMPNHFHFLIRIREEDEIRKAARQDIKDISVYISRAFSNFFNAYAKAYNKMFERRGSLFLSNLKRKNVTDIDYLCRLVHYIHYNPAHHGFVKDPSDWKHSSYYSWFSDEDSFIEKKEVMGWFGGKEGFKEYHLNLRVSKTPEV